MLTKFRYSPSRKQLIFVIHYESLSSTNTRTLFVFKRLGNKFILKIEANNQKISLKRWYIIPEKNNVDTKSILIRICGSNGHIMTQHYINKTADNI